jgi:hypothetical protein
MNPRPASRLEGLRTRQGARRPASDRRTELWRLPSGRRLAEFALASGFLAPTLMQPRRRTTENKEP